MKTLTKFFVAVAVLLAGFACTTDATEELGVNSDVAQTEIVLSLEESRTQLGEKVDGVYPLYWSEGDKIAVNGVTSNEVATEAVGASAATFVVNGTVSHPYNIVYPAPAEGISAVTEGCYPVVFPATQTYVAGNIDGNAAAMYGYAEEGTTPTLTHLTGVLCFAVKGEVSLANLTLTSDSGAIAGTYDVNCATGALTAQEGTTSNVITVSFGEGLALSTETTPIYVAVPAGEYGVIQCMLTTTEGKKMIATFDSSAKPISAGKVREFAEFEFAETVEKITEIDSKEALIAFAAAPTTSAVVTATIDMSGYEWSSIEGFESFTFDGGKDKGFEIKGLSAPLFGTTSGKIKNLKLTGVAITETTYGRTGAIARMVHNGTLNDCYAEGTLLMNNTVYNETLADDYSNINIGGLVGHSVGGTFKDCYNKVAITVTSVCLPSSTNKYPTSVGGIVGLALTSSAFENCTNDAKILYNGTSGPAAATYLSGIIGRIKVNHDTSILKNLTNTANGVIEFPKDAVCGGSLYMRGCVGVIYDGQVAVEDITNRADLKFYGTAKGDILSMAGVGGNLGAGLNNEAYRLNNYGNIYACGNVPNAVDPMRIGGVVTETAGTVTHKIHDCHNYGAITVSVQQKADISAYIGGFMASHTNGVLALDKCVNEGSVTVEATASNYNVPEIAGMVGYVTKSYDCTDCENKGDVTFKATSKGNTCIGGFFAVTDIASGNDDSKLTNCVNSGNVTHSGTVGNNLFMGGFIGYIPNDPPLREWVNCENKGHIKIEANVPGSARAGGFVGGTYSSLKFTSCTNSGAVTCASLVKDDTDAKTLAAGFVGDSEKGTPTATFTAADESKGIKPCKNTGTITITGNLNQYARVSGIGNLDHTDGGIIGNDLINEGQIVAKDMTGKGYIQIGGVTGCHIKGSKWVNVKNKGEILVENVNAGYIIAGGISGHSASGSIAEGKIVNIGDITVQNCTFTSPASVRVGGLVASPYVAIADAECHCTIKAEGLAGHVGMLFGGARSTDYPVTNAKVGGAVATERDPADETFKVVTLTGENYFNYLYSTGEATDWGTSTNYDGCTFLKTKPTF